MTKPTQNESIAMLTTSAGQALEYSRQALAVLDMWINTLAPDDEMESFRVAAVHGLVSQASEYLVKVREVRPCPLFIIWCAVAMAKLYSVFRPAAAIWWTRRTGCSRCAPLWTTRSFSRWRVPRAF